MGKKAMTIKKLNTEKAYLWWAIGIILGAVAVTIFPAFPYIEFAGTWTLGFLGVGAKQMIEKHVNFNGESHSR